MIWESWGKNSIFGHGRGKFGERWHFWPRFGENGIFGQGLGKSHFWPRSGEVLGKQLRSGKVWGNGIFGQGLGKFGENGIFGQGLGMFGNIVIMIKDNPQKRTITKN